MTSECSSTGTGMRALILVGGFGTRLRPLTFTVPKPLVPFCNKPMIIHQVEALKEAGVTEVVLAVAYRPDAMKEEMDAWGEKLGVKFVFSLEEEPMGTAGPLALARDILMQDDKPFFVLNSDVTCRFPLRELLAFHKNHGKEGTIMVTKVSEWDKYGVVVYDKSNFKIEQFVEKPKTYVGDRINAGIYVFNKSILNRIPKQRTSIEKEIFPQMAGAGQLFAYNLESFWMDIGQPADFIQGTSKYLLSVLGTDKETEEFWTEETEVGGDITVLGCCLVDKTAKIGRGSVIGPNVAIGRNCVIGENCRIENSSIFENTKVGKATRISKSIIGWNNVIGSWCHITNTSVLGDDVTVEESRFANGVKVLPNKTISTHYFEPAIIM
ncbi:mannose-1-phosphate guanylyltransferase [Angomonas deanei]|uniref:mannose-1-phosphate guanylyltransferase n=1 Tax=Angomonas deanei TaxID=59799 RepID=S9UK69_9TRYP|nr:mannose-1-phosphate guanyltransferase [Angomonas deanei]EPY38733.1 mannose-1-phosphate guanylyltransferase [Angomonas deanei]CAD2219108.1 MobA-like NTP transferase domain/Nucleotidyl transferase/Bacterial transferase hexapeptide (six repeats), putative [Angomonas deanei]|eukprot:EPY29323.1 mannose-1-phosphate guanyltransferase [Angomonas deanei]